MEAGFYQEDIVYINPSIIPGLSPSTHAIIDSRRGTKLWSCTKEELEERKEEEPQTLERKKSRIPRQGKTRCGSRGYPFIGMSHARVRLPVCIFTVGVVKRGMARGGAERGNFREGFRRWLGMRVGSGGVGSGEV